ncbi:hypothetical protein [Paenibacillus dakarensis]|uniref:hypothetical protein n=1 Tax=Paenibacillus dakarensis TaxID=1527293 RepID=UPI0006D5A3D2|nr:hypothetical protein [Paenibacillus dakarensis]
MSEQNKIDEIKEALAAASTQYEWDTDGISIEWKDGHPLKGTYRHIALTQSLTPTCFRNENHENDATFIAKAPEYITYLLAEIERKDEALKWYADEDNYDPIHLDKVGFIPIDDDSGKRAREAL